jgi:hypothetical protein
MAWRHTGNPRSRWCKLEPLRPAALPPVKTVPVYNSIGGRLGPRDTLDALNMKNKNIGAPCREPNTNCSVIHPLALLPHWLSHFCEAFLKHSDYVAANGWRFLTICLTMCLAMRLINIYLNIRLTICLTISLTITLTICLTILQHSVQKMSYILPSILYDNITLNTATCFDSLWDDHQEITLK